jgi:hypothetical protein
VATELEKVLLQQHLNEVLALPESCRWRLEKDDSFLLGVTVVLHSTKAPQDLYKARLNWADYSKPASLKFLSMNTGVDNDATAWPVFFGSRPQALLCCVPYTAEGHVLHPDWAGLQQTRYEEPENPLLYVLLTLQHALDTTYEGRYHA